MSTDGSPNSASTTTGTSSTSASTTTSATSTSSSLRLLQMLGMILCLLFVSLVWDFEESQVFKVGAQLSQELAHKSGIYKNKTASATGREATELAAPAQAAAATPLKAYPPGVDPNLYNHSMTVEDYYQMVPTVPNKMWLTQCGERVAEDPSIVIPFPTERPGYTLGDCLLMCQHCTYGQFHEYKPPGSRRWKRTMIGNETIAYVYGRKICDKGLYGDPKGDPFRHTQAIKEVFESFENRSYFTPLQPDPHAFVLHIRVGDVMDGGHQGQSPGGLLIQGGVGDHPGFRRGGIKSIRSFFEYYETTERVFQREGNETNHHPNLEKKVILVGGSHRPQFYKKSRTYVTCLQRAFAKAGYQTEMYFDRALPDVDFYYMAHAKKYIPSTGTFSLMIAEMVEKLGGKVYGRKLLPFQHNTTA